MGSVSQWSWVAQIYQGPLRILANTPSASFNGGLKYIFNFLNSSGKIFICLNKNVIKRIQIVLHNILFHCISFLLRHPVFFVRGIKKQY